MRLPMMGSWDPAVQSPAEKMDARRKGPRGVPKAARMRMSRHRNTDCPWFAGWRLTDWDPNEPKHMDELPPGKP